MLAWNHYVQATLHFWLCMFHQLFSYQKIMCRLTTKYKFEAYYNYDRDFRLLQVSQVSLKPEQRTAKWESVHPELTNIHLQADSMLPVCFHCRANGHCATNCPEKPSSTRASGEAGSNFRNAAANFNHAVRSTNTYHSKAPTIELPGTPSTGMLSQGVHAADSTRDYFVPNHPANSRIHTTNVTKAIQGVKVNTLPTLHSCLQHSNPLPTLVSITINIVKFNNFLINHPNQALVGYVVNGLWHWWVIL